MTSLILSKCSYITFSQSYTGAQHQIAAFERFLSVANSRLLEVQRVTYQRAFVAFALAADSSFSNLRSARPKVFAGSL